MTRRLIFRRGGIHTITGRRITSLFRCRGIHIIMGRHIAGLFRYRGIHTITGRHIAGLFRCRGIHTITGRHIAGLFRCRGIYAIIGIHISSLLLYGNRIFIGYILITGCFIRFLQPPLECSTQILEFHIDFPSYSLIYLKIFYYNHPSMSMLPLFHIISAFIRNNRQPSAFMTRLRRMPADFLLYEPTGCIPLPPQKYL